MAKDLKILNIDGEDYDVGYSKTTKDITVAGVSATVGTGTIKEGTVIPKGTDMDAFLKMLLVKEIYPTVSYVQPTLVGKFDEATALTVALSNNGAVQEVGTAINLLAITSPVSSYQMQGVPASVSGLTHGYSALLNGPIEEKESIIASWGSVEPISEHDAFTIEVTSFSGFTGTKPALVKGPSPVEMPQQSIGSLSEGVNSITVVAKPPRYTGNNPGIGARYIVSNVGGRSEEHKTNAIAAVNITADNAPAPTTIKGTRSVTGKYRCAVVSNVDLSTTAMDSAFIGKQAFFDPLTSGKSKTFSSSFTASSGKSIVVVVPPGYSLTGIKSSLGSDVDVSNYTMSEAVRTVGGTGFTYKIYTYTNNGAADVVNKDFLITKD